MSQKSSPHTSAPAIIWFRRDLRVVDNPALTAAVDTRRPVVAVFIKDETVDSMGACPKWRLSLSIAALEAELQSLGLTLVLRSGNAFDVLTRLVHETGAAELHYTREYTPEAIARDTSIKADLGIPVSSHNGSLLFEPWTVETKTGGFYKVYTPLWKAVRDRPVAEPLAAPRQIVGVTQDIPSEPLDSWKWAAGMDRGADVVAAHVCVGERAAQDRLRAFCEDLIGSYKSDRDRLDLDATSRLSENLAYGEISPRMIWHAGQRAMQAGALGAEHFLKELVWREFAYHLLYHSPHILERNWRDGWDAFPWRGDTDEAERWRRGQTGEPVGDAAMREMYVTGQMHNRARMIVASYLTKHLMVHWRVGMDWFAECLTDWDPASNAMGWQWVAGCGPDAAPFFRIFNPETQAEKFDPLSVYRRTYLDPDAQAARAFVSASPRSWNMQADGWREARLVDLKAGRERALGAYKAFTNDGRESEQR